MEQADSVINITALLKRWSAGEQGCKDLLYDRLYQELHDAARAQLRGEFGSTPFQPTELIHETYLKLVHPPDVEWQDRNHFLALAARLMRQILVDRARYETAQRRDRALQVTLTLASQPAEKPDFVDILALDSALQHLAELNERQARIVELRYFAGLSVAETAAMLKCSEATVNRDWKAARLWLFDALEMGA